MRVAPNYMALLYVVKGCVILAKSCITQPFTT